MTELNVPNGVTTVLLGDGAWLKCLYEMEGDELYSIKWYHNGHEFYRYNPTSQPKTTVYDGNGIRVDVSYYLINKKNYLYIFSKRIKMIWRI